MAQPIGLASPQRWNGSYPASPSASVGEQARIGSNFPTISINARSPAFEIVSRSTGFEAEYLEK